MKKWKIKLSKYGISASRYDELKAFCKQYPEWKEYLRNEVGQPQSPIISDMPKSPNSNPDKILNLVSRRVEFETKAKLVEDTAREADPEFWECLIKNICFNSSITCLQMMDGMPLSQNAFYNKRRYFFYLLDQRKT